MDIKIKNETLGKMLCGSGYYSDIGETLNSFVAECHAGGAAMAKALPEYLNVKAKTFFRKLVEEINELEKQEEEEEGKAEEIFYTVGDKFEQSDHDEIYQLHNLGGDAVALVKITRDCDNPIGYIWVTYESRKVKDIHEITREEFARIADNEAFKLIKN